jgi:hypothetical protein
MDTIMREYPRTSKSIRAMISISLDGLEGYAIIRSSRKDKGIRLMSETKNISWSGYCLKFGSLPEDPDNLFSREKAHKLVGRTIKMILSNPKLTIWGDVIRFDYKAREVAVVITKVSDYGRWQTVCEAGGPV